MAGGKTTAKEELKGMASTINDKIKVKCPATGKKIPGSTLTEEDWKRLEKNLDRRYGATAVILPRPWYQKWNPFYWLYELMLDMYSFR